MSSAKTFEHAETLAMALAQAGRFDEAITWQQELIARSKQQGDRTTTERLEHDLVLYERAEPCCAPRPN